MPALRLPSGLGSCASPALADRLKLLAGLSALLLAAAYLGPGIAFGGSESPAGAEDRELAGADQYEPAGEPDKAAAGEPRTDGPRTALPPGTGEDRPRSGAGRPAPPGTSPEHGGPGATVSGLAASGPGGFRPRIPVTSGAGGSGRGSLAAGDAVSYNARSYCRTYEGGGGSPVAPADARAVFPLPETYFDSYDDTWGAARPQGNHEGTDLMSPTGTPLYALTDGTVVRLSGANANGWNYLGGYTVMIRAAYSIGPIKKGDLLYYAHMQRETSLEIGDRVEAGDRVGVVGDTGYGSEGTRGKFPPHLHLGWYDTTGTTSLVPSGAMNPYPLLEWLKRNGGTAAGGWGSERATERYCDYQERLPAEPPASRGGGEDHGHDLPPGVSSGSSADLDTGSPDPRPSPVVKRAAKQAEQSERSRTITRAAPWNPEPRRSPSGGGEETAQPGSGAPDRREPDRIGRPEPGPPGGARKPGIDRTREVPASARGNEESGDGLPAGETSPSAAPTRSERGSPGEVSKPEEKPGAGSPAPKREPGSGTAGRQPTTPSILPVVFRDEDADGRRDAGEPEMEGWSVAVAGRGAELATGRSGARVRGLEPGVYRVSVKPERGYVRTTAQTVRVRVGGREPARAEFGFVETAELAVRACGDGPGEPCREVAVSGRWRLELREEGGRRLPAAETVRSGVIRFSDLLPGVYELTFEPRRPGSPGVPESRILTLDGGESRSLVLRDEPPAERREAGENNVETPARETEEEGP